MMRIARLLLFGALALSAPLSSHLLPDSAAYARAPKSCGSDTYVNIRGNCVHRPVKADRPPVGASAKCRDGTYTKSH